MLNKKNSKKKVPLQYKVLYVIISILIVIILIMIDILFIPEKKNPMFGNSEMMGDLKPVIYLYPESKENITVTLDYKGEIVADYPKYDSEIKGWNVTAYPDGKILNNNDKEEYSYLFWEGERYNTNWNIQKGFVVPGHKTRDFLQETLPKLGLTPKEYNEFIVFWYPLLQNNRYNLLYFAGEDYSKLAPLNTIPKYDSLLRVFMVAQALDTPIDIEPQTFKTFERTGFTVVEWGGTIIKQ